MATIEARPDREGRTRYTARIRLKRGGAIYYRESKTFTREAEAKRWGREREVELQRPGAIERVQAGPTSVGALVKWYRETFEQVSKWQRSKGAALKQLEGTKLAERDAITLTTQQVVDHVLLRRRDGAGPATVAGDLVWIGVVLRAAKSVKSLPVRPEVVAEARVACRELRLTGRSRKRDRRPTEDELAKLCEFFAGRPRSDIPMADIVRFAVESARREAEICRLEWADLDEKEGTCLVRDAKHPKAKLGNHRRFKLTAAGLALVQAQPRPDGATLIFPYNPKSVGAAFTRACAVLGIVDLHFHDLRHEATSRLFEAGYSIPEVAMFTLHDSWQELKRYANIKPSSVKLR